MSIFGITEKALAVAEERADLISGNLVNSGTPHYKAKDINFEKAMQQAMSASSGSVLTATNAHHIQGGGGTPSTHTQIQYRIPMQTSLDGNTVDPEIERKNFLENALKYQVSLTFIQSKTDQLMKVIKGE